MTLNKDLNPCIYIWTEGACKSTWLLIKRKYIYSQLMNVISIRFLFCFITPTLVLFAAWIFGQRTITDREKSSPFECGFDPRNSARLPFSIRFFLLAIIFIVFDIEIVLLTPVPLIMLFSNLVYSLFITGLFLLILLTGLVYEWKEGSLDWSF